MIFNRYLVGLYRDDLANPIPSHESPGLLGLDPSEESRRTIDARRHKLPALFAHFAIDVNAADAWEQLAMALGATHVPGFQVQLPTPMLWSLTQSLPPNKRRPGRPRKAARAAGADWSRAGLLLLPEEPAPKRLCGRPVMHSMEEKASLVAVFDAVKAEHAKTDREAAMAIVGVSFPEMNTYRRREKANTLVSKIRRWRVEVRRFENPAENPADV